MMTTSEIAWLTVGAVAQACFGARMLIQWWMSEKRGRSVVPVSFWYLSVVASVLMLAYAAWRRDPIFVAGQVLGLAVYGRNLVLLFRTKEFASEVRELPTNAGVGRSPRQFEDAGDSGDAISSDPSSSERRITSRDLNVANSANSECECPCVCGRRNLARAA